MQKKRLLSLILAAVLCLGLFPATAAAAEGEEAIPIFEDTSYSFEERAADLVARMTLAQKGSQMISQGSSAIAADQLGGGALNVPATKGISSYTWWSEALHGYSYGSGSTNATSYPQNLSAGSTWNPELYYRQATLISDEIRERTATNSLGNAINLTFYSPTVNLQRDPRWGRNEESYSEDVYLNSVMGTQFVLGMEGKDQNGDLLDEDGYYKTVTTVKHYTANNSERNRLDGGAVTDLRALREYYTAPYRNIIQDADVSSVMTAYSTVNGEPSSMSSYLMDTLLRQTWGFSGYVTSDCDSVSTIKRHAYVNPHTGSVLTTVEQLSQAMAHGEDLECSGGYNSGVGTYASNISAMVSAGVDTDKGTFTENQVDISLHRLMTARIKTGEFDDDVSYTEEAAVREAAYGSATGANQTAERLAVADDVAEEAVVLLQNNNSVLPLDVTAEGYKLVIVGAWQTNMYLGLYSTTLSTNTINIQQGITNAVKAVNADAAVTYIASNTLTAADEAAISAADAVIVVVGTTNSYSAEDKDRTTIALPDNQAALISKVGGLNNRTVAVMETCGPVQVTEFADDVAAILWSSFGGIHKGVGFGNVITGAVNPSGRLTATWYQNVSDTGTSDIPAITNYNLYHTGEDSGRTYMYYQGETPVSYPFGYGLSYTTFEYSDLALDKASYNADDTITATFKVTNTGTAAGKEVAQLYVAQPGAEASLNRPLRRLEGFEKIELDAGESTTVTIQVSIPDLAFYNESTDRYIVDTGSYQIQVGSSSATAALTLTKDLTVSGAMTVVPEVVTVKANQSGDTAKGIEERLIFDKGTTVNPQVTVAMNDESLYGYIIADQKSPIMQKSSTALPEGMTVTYSTNRASVVQVEGSTITTVGPGVATVTATVTYNGTSVTDEFVVYVESTPYLENIQVNGTNIAGFQSETFEYSVTLTGSGMPTVTPVSAGGALETVVTMPVSLPGIATVQTMNADTGETATYRIGLGTVPVNTDFKAGKEAVLAKGWHVLNENAGMVSWSGESGLTVTTEQGAFGADTTPKNLYLQSGFGDWVAQTEITFDAAPDAAGQQAGLVVYNSSTDYIRFVYETPASGNNVLRVYRAAGGTESTVASVSAAGLTSLKLQIVKQGSSYSFRYCTDGTVWNVFSQSATAAYICPQIGVLATNGASADAGARQVTFSGLGIFSTSQLYPKAQDILADGTTINGFDAGIYTYNFAVADNETKIPVITSIPDAGCTVTVKQTEAVTGTATVTVSSDIASTTYVLNYGYGPRSDYFADGDFDTSVWTVLNSDAAAYTVEKGKGVVLPTQQYDIYSTSGSGRWKNCFVTSAMGDDWEVVAKVFYPQVPNANYQQAMFLVWQDQDNYLRLNCQQSSLTIEPLIEINGSTSSTGLTKGYADKSDDGTVTLYLKFKKEGTAYNFAYSQDGVSYTSLGTASNINFTNPKLGLFASMNNSGTQIKVDYEYMTVTRKGGVEQKTYQQMLEDATQNVLNYVAADLGTSVAETEKRLTLSAVPHGYTLSFTSDNTDVIASDGTIIHDEDEAKTAALTLTVTDTAADITKTASVTLNVPAYKIVKNVTADPAPGVYTDTQTVTLSTATADAAIYYTTDGTDPTSASTLYTGPITVDDTMLIKAIGLKDEYVDSDITAFDYYIYESKLDMPAASHRSGSIFTEATQVTLSAAEGAAIYYTTDGTAPTKASTLYTGPITVDATVTIKAAAFMSRHEPSNVAAFNYFYATGTNPDDAGETQGRDDISLKEEYEDYFLMGTFGEWTAGDWSYNGNVSSPANDLKLDSQIGSSNTNSLSRRTYQAAVAAIEADETLTAEEKTAALQEANENVMLDSGSRTSGISKLEAVRAWNEANPDDQRSVRAHVLAWHGGQQPNYFFCEGFYYDSSKTLAEQVVDEETMLARLDNYINKMMQTYAEYDDIIIAWDVVNEAIDDYTGQVRNSEDYQTGQWGTVFRHAELDGIVGDTAPAGVTFADVGDARLYAESAWIRQAFASARHWSDEYGCDWKLYYNDFQDSNKPYEPKMSQTIKMLSWIADDDIDGYGMQGRLAFAYPTIAMIQNQIDRALSETGCEEISFTEADIRSDFIVNPDYDATQPSTRVVADDPQWPQDGSGSYASISAANGNTFDVTNSPVKRDPNWGTGSNNTLATSTEKMTAQADFAADLMDLLIGYAKEGKVAAFQWDGASDSNTFNSTTGCTMWDSSGTPKYSYYAVAGAPSRDKLSEVLDGAPANAQSGKYSTDSWTAYQEAKTIAAERLSERIYDQEGIDQVKLAAAALQQAIDNLVEVIPGSVSFLEKGNAKNYTILNQASSKIVEGKGLLLTNTRGTIMSDSNVDEASNLNRPQDLVVTSANGDWTATVKVRDVSSGPWYYGYFNFLAMDDYDNHVGFLVGDSSVDIKWEKDGVQTSIVVDSSGSISSTPYYRIAKSGDDYTFFTSTDCETWKQIAEVEDTGLNNVKLALDSYGSKSYTQAKTMYVEYLHVMDAENTQTTADFALRNVSGYLSRRIPSMIVFPSGSRTVQLPVLSGYTVTYVSDNVEVVSETGLITAPQDTTALAIRLKISDGTHEYLSDPIDLTVSGMAFDVANVTFTPDSLGKVTGDMNVTVVMENTSHAAQSCTMIVALYDPDGRMVDHGSVGKTVASGGSETFDVGFRVPFDAGSYAGYVLKVFVWDGDSILNTNGIPLSGVSVLST